MTRIDRLICQVVPRAILMALVADGRLVEMIELPGHPLWVGTQAHPEFKSRPDRPHPLFKALIEAALGRAEGRKPHLIDPDGLGAGIPEVPLALY